MSEVDNRDLEGPEIDRRTTLKLLSAAGMTGLAGCTGGDGDESGGSSKNGADNSSVTMGGSIEAGFQTDNLEFLDPHYVDKGAQMQIVSNVFSGLLKLDKDSKMVGDLAKDWEIPDKKTYVFQLHEGVTFHNGDPLKAEQVKWSLDRLMADEKSEHHGKVTTIESVEATGSHEVTIKMSEPTAPFLAFMTNVPGRAGSIVHKNAEDDPKSYNKKPIGSGPFKVKSRSMGESITLSKFDDYWETDDKGDQLPYLDEVKIRLIPEPSTMWSAITSESIQHCAQITGQFAKQGENMSALNVRKTSSGDWSCIAPLGADPAKYSEKAKVASGYDKITTKWKGKDIPTANKKVRQAIAMAIDRDEIVKKAYFGYATPAHSIFNPTMSIAYEKEPKTGQYHDPEKAKRLLDEAGYTGNPRFSFKLLGMPEYKRWMTIIQQQLSDVGINVELDIQQPSSYWDSIYRYDHMVTTYGGSTDIDPYMTWWKQLGTPDPETSLGVWQKSMMFDKKFDDALLKSFKTPKPKKRKQHIRKAEEVFLDQAMYTMTVFMLKAKIDVSSLKNVGIQAGMSNFHQAYLEK
ncbi:ABC transporter substrate-binding protein [Haladaptatus caseinilyticus]|uniref:ABC transporter substrate-binding protein n=1 Tax=Haladaptatus caseinilyticus TaxID=2993314 RepID=UPI00224A8D7F|nr:ABC transporter substrate-binding protein [Haladaptatus caseinilyticus]